MPFSNQEGLAIVAEYVLVVNILQSAWTIAKLQFTNTDNRLPPPHPTHPSVTPTLSSNTSPRWDPTISPHTPLPIPTFGARFASLYTPVSRVSMWMAPTDFPLLGSNSFHLGILLPSGPVTIGAAHALLSRPDWRLWGLTISAGGYLRLRARASNKSHSKGLRPTMAPTPKPDTSLGL